MRKNNDKRNFSFRSAFSFHIMSESILDNAPIDMFHEFRDIILPHNAIIANIRMLEHIHDEKRYGAREMPGIVLVHPYIEQPPGRYIAIQPPPADPPHRAHRREILFPQLV